MLRSFFNKRLLLNTSSKSLNFSFYQLYSTANKIPFDEHKKQQSKVSDKDGIITNILQDKFEPDILEVEDQSCGCGSFYRIKVISDKFKGKRILQQHQMIKAELADIMKELHGVTLETGSKNETFFINK